MTNPKAGKFDRRTNPGTAVCTVCGARRQRANGERSGAEFICTPCFNRAGDENSVADGYMTCADFRAQYGEHSEYCDCAPEAPALPTCRKCGAATVPADRPHWTWCRGCVTAHRAARKAAR